VSVNEDEARAQGRREAAPVALLVLVGFVALAIISQIKGWHLLNLSWWIWLVLAVPAGLLVVDLVLWLRGKQGVVRSRQAALFLLGVLVAANIFAVAILVFGLLTTSTTRLSGAELLFNAIAIWSANVLVFGLLYWEVDCGGPVARIMAAARPTPDLLFPQDGLSPPPPGWQPQVWDYIYVSLTNSIAFSPTDTLPMTLRAKWWMGLESGIAAFTVLLVFARAVNVIAA
jgi:hypothetical protein